jgi:hypothetical protein
MTQNSEYLTRTVILNVINDVNGETYTISLEVPFWRLALDGSFWWMDPELHKVTHPSLDKFLAGVG